MPGGHTPIGQGGPPPKKGKKANSAKGQFIWAEGQQESGGDYGAVNSSSGALGRWQVMPDNLPGWAAQCGLPVKMPSEYLADHAYQDKLIWCVLGGYYDKYGPRGAAAVWYCGQDTPDATYGDPPVYQYVNDVMALDKSAPYVTGGPGGVGGTPGTGSGPVVFPPVPKPGKEDWSPQVRSVSGHFHAATSNLQSAKKAVGKLKVRRQ
jgi:hypothetical protein